MRVMPGLTSLMTLLFAVCLVRDCDKPNMFMCIVVLYEFIMYEYMSHTTVIVHNMYFWGLFMSFFDSKYFYCMQQCEHFVQIPQV